MMPLPPEIAQLHTAFYTEQDQRTIEQAALVEKAAYDWLTFHIHRHDLQEFPASPSPAEKLADSAKRVVDAGMRGMFFAEGGAEFRIRREFEFLMAELEIDLYAYWATTSG